MLEEPDVLTQMLAEFPAGRLKHGSHSGWKTWKNRRAFSSQGILLRLEKSGNFTKNTGKIRKNYIGKLKQILEKAGKFVSQRTF